MGQPYKCPICNGTGTVPNGFYNQNLDGWYTSTTTRDETCRSCNGTGIVWERDEL